jgi:hypothetical protein
MEILVNQLGICVFCYYSRNQLVAELGYEVQKNRLEYVYQHFLKGI